MKELKVEMSSVKWENTFLKQKNALLKAHLEEMEEKLLTHSCVQKEQSKMKSSNCDLKHFDDSERDEVIKEIIKQRDAEIEKYKDASIEIQCRLDSLLYQAKSNNLLIFSG